MTKRRLNIGCVAIVLLVIFAGIKLGRFLSRVSDDNNRIYETLNAQGVDKTWFVEAFMPGVNADDVLSLNYICTGGREPPFIGIMHMTTNGLAQLRANTEHSETGTFADGSIRHRWWTQPEVVNNLAAHVGWWSIEDSITYESRQIHWKGDHASKFFIPPDDNPIYIEAVIH